MIGIYHSKDLDGIASGAIIKHKYPDAIMIGYDYGQPYDHILEAVKDEDVIMADISLPMDVMAKICWLSNRKGFVWIDHHISAIKDYHKYMNDCEAECVESDLNCEAVLEDGIAACEATWKYLFPDDSDPIPLAIKFLSEYDTWKNSNKDHWENTVLPFQFGMRLHCNSVDSFPKHLFCYSEVKFEDYLDIVNEGETVLKYQAQVNERQCKSVFGRFMHDENLSAICINGGGFNSDVFKSIYDKDKYDIMVCFQYTGEHWVISLYTTKDNIDCSVIAKSYGGGGHKKAAGFVSTTLPYWIEPQSRCEYTGEEIVEDECLDPEDCTCTKTIQRKEMGVGSGCMQRV